MARINFDRDTARIYHHGVDRAVIYPQDGSAGLPWNGVTSFSRDPDTTSAGRETYQDGIRSFDVRRSDPTFSIASKYYPDALTRLEGGISDTFGIYMSGGRPSRSDMTVRTLLGNDSSGPNHAYILHLLYDVSITESSYPYQSDGRAISPSDFNWTLTPNPSDSSGGSPSGYVSIRSDQVGDGRMAYIENILYGTSSSIPRMIRIDELLNIIPELRFVIPALGLPGGLYPESLPGDWLFDVRSGIVWQYGITKGPVRDVFVGDPKEAIQDPRILPEDLVYDPETNIIYRVRP